MKIYITTHGRYEYEHNSLCTTDLELAIKHFIDYSKESYCNSMSTIAVWEDNKLIFEYGDMNYHLINRKKEITYEELKEDFLEYLNEKVQKENKYNV